MFSVKGPGVRIIAAVVAVICIIAGIYLNFFQSRGFVKTTAEIISVRESPGDAEDSRSYIPTVQYVVGGRTYTSELNEGSSSYTVGKTIPVLYDPNDPATVHAGGGFKIYILIVGVVILAVLLYSAIKGKQSQKQVREQQESLGQTHYAPSFRGEEREVYFLTDTGTPKYGHRIEDADRRVLYEAKMTKFSLATPYGFDFIDHEHGRTVPHLVGHEEEAEVGGLLFDSNYTFTLDGEDIWKHLKRNGVSVETERMEGAIWPRWRVFRDGEQIAVLESSSQYVHEEDAEAHSLMNKVAVPGFYRIWTSEETLDVVFVTAMAFARSRALNDEGGTFGKQLRSSLKKGLGRQ